MNRQSLHHIVRLGIIQKALGVLFCAALVSLLLVRPVSGRWDIPDTIELHAEGHSSPAMASVQMETPTPVPLPDHVQAPILMYHYVSELPSNPDRYRYDLTVLPENLQAQLQYLTDAGYHTVTLSDLYLHLTQGYPLPEQPVVLTFDDGYTDAYTVVFPLLLEYGFTGTFFVLATQTHLEAPGYLTWAQIKEMSDAGMDIQAHGRDHVDLRGRSYDYLVYQTLGAQEAIQQHTGRLPRFFCYPSGKYDANVIAVLKSEGYWGAVTTKWGATHTLESFFEMPRIRIRGADTLESFIDKLTE